LGYPKATEASVQGILDLICRFPPQAYKLCEMLLSLEQDMIVYRSKKENGLVAVSAGERVRHLTEQCFVEAMRELPGYRIGADSKNEVRCLVGPHDDRH